MANGGRFISPAVLLEARRLYEETDVTVASIAVLLDVDERSVYRQAKRRGWRPRRPQQPGGASVPVAPPSMDTPPAVTPAGGEPRIRDALPRRELIARLVQRIEVEIAAVERLVERAGRGRETDGVVETERAARTLAILVRSLRELAALEKNEPESDDDAARDADAFRRELGETLERVLAAGAAC